ncbi:MAG: sigma 54-interacting transcriptional regulator [Deltaproteobacteria bacterium]|nr:sigma 54-interacting transcriptional regulator [Deltaproteobacteria bacterium]
MSDAPTAPGTLTSATPATAAPRWGLAVVHSPDAALMHRHVPVGDGLVIGRLAASDRHLSVGDPRLSREHAEIVPSSERSDAFVITDRASRNGTFVDATRVTTRPLRPGAIVRVGDTLFEFGPLAQASLPLVEDPALIGRAPAFRAVLARLARVAATDVVVLLTGETGTGKEVVARRLHELSGRPGPLIAVNCAALPAELVESTLFGHRRGAFTGATSESPGFFGEARGGTLFLDEIGELPLAQQAKLLRVLENHEYAPVGSASIMRSDARVIAATNTDLPRAVADGRFRNDLLARLAGAVIELPPLRARRSDIPLLARRFLAELAPGRKLTLSASAIERLVLSPWSRNIRELRTVMQRIVLGDGGDREIGVSDLELGAPPPPAVARERSRATEARPAADDLAEVLARHRGNVSKVAAHYGKDVKQVYRWMQRYALSPDAFREVQ